MSSGPGNPQIGVQTYGFGRIIYDGPEGQVIADAGDLVLSIKDGESETFAVMTPWAALEVAENIATAAERGMRLIHEHDSELG